MSEANSTGVGSSSRLPLFLCGLMVLFLLSTILSGQPKMTRKKVQVSYQVGERLDAESFVLDREGTPRKVLDLIDDDAGLVVLVLFGGGVKAPPERLHFRGDIWCEDSFDDLAIQRAAVHAFKDEPVQFIGVAVPPIFHSELFGWDKGVFRGSPAASEAYEDSVDVFIRNTDRLRESGLIPFERLYFDPRFRLSMNQEEDLGESYGTVHPWQGKLKWHKDPRTYGTPTIWFLDARGKVLAEPLFGNDYDGDPPEVYYGYSELRDRIRTLLAKESSR